MPEFTVSIHCCANLMEDVALDFTKQRHCNAASKHEVVGTLAYNRLFTMGHDGNVVTDVCGRHFNLLLAGKALNINARQYTVKKENNTMDDIIPNTYINEQLPLMDTPFAGLTLEDEVDLAIQQTEADTRAFDLGYKDEADMTAQLDYERQLFVHSEVESHIDLGYKVPGCLPCVFALQTDDTIVVDLSDVTMVTDKEAFVQEIKDLAGVSWTCSVCGKTVDEVLGITILLDTDEVVCNDCIGIDSRGYEIDINSPEVGTFEPRLWDADPNVCCPRFQLGACEHTESFVEDQTPDVWMAGDILPGGMPGDFVVSEYSGMVDWEPVLCSCGTPLSDDEDYCSKAKYTCGSCKSKHHNPAEVKACYDVKRNVGLRIPDQMELAHFGSTKVESNNVTCHSCDGKGVRVWGTCTNGVWSNSGKCMCCLGKGFQTPADVKRDSFYHAHALGNS